MPKNLIKRGGTYSARYVVPTKLRSLLGCSQIVRTTGTGCLREAEKRKYRILADIQDEVERRVRNSEANPRSPKWITAAAVELAKQSGDTLDEDTVSSILSDLIDEHLKARGEDPDDIGGAHLRTLRAAFTILDGGTGDDALPLSTAIDRHLSEKEGRVNESTISRQRRVLESFAEWAGDPEVST